MSSASDDSGKKKSKPSVKLMYEISSFSRFKQILDTAKKCSEGKKDDDSAGEIITISWLESGELQFHGVYHNGVFGIVAALGHPHITRKGSRNAIKPLRFDLNTLCRFAKMFDKRVKNTVVILKVNSAGSLLFATPNNSNSIFMSCIHSDKSDEDFAESQAEGLNTDFGKDYSIVIPLTITKLQTSLEFAGDKDDDLLISISTDPDFPTRGRMKTSFTDQAADAGHSHHVPLDLAVAKSLIGKDLSMRLYGKIVGIVQRILTTLKNVPSSQKKKKQQGADSTSSPAKKRKITQVSQVSQEENGEIKEEEEKESSIEHQNDEGESNESIEEEEEEEEFANVELRFAAPGIPMCVQLSSPGLRAKIFIAPKDEGI